MAWAIGHPAAGAAWIGGLAWRMMHLRTDAGTAHRVAARVSRVAFGAHHRMRGLPWLRKSGDIATLRATLRRELVVMGIVLLLGGALSSTALPEPSHAHVAGHFQHP